MVSVVILLIGPPFPKTKVSDALRILKQHRCVLLQLSTFSFDVSLLFSCQYVVCELKRWNYMLITESFNARSLYCHWVSSVIGCETLPFVIFVFNSRLFPHLLKSISSFTQVLLLLLLTQFLLETDNFHLFFQVFVIYFFFLKDTFPKSRDYLLQHYVFHLCVVFGFD